MVESGHGLTSQNNPGRDTELSSCGHLLINPATKRDLFACNLLDLEKWDSSSWPFKRIQLNFLKISERQVSVLFLQCSNPYFTGSRAPPRTGMEASASVAGAAVIRYFHDLPLPSAAVCLEYVWITKDALAGNAAALKSKTKIVDKPPVDLESTPSWIFDGKPVIMHEMRPQILVLQRCRLPECAVTGHHGVTPGGLCRNRVRPSTRRGH